MCGRVNIIDAPLYAFFARFLNLPLQIETALNIGPTERVWALKQSDGVFEALPLRWWLVPSWSNGPQSKFSMFNARAETLQSSKAYAGPFKRQRCAIPVASYLEWRGPKKERQPFSIEREDGEALVLGGLWDSWQGPDGLIQSCTIVTTAAPSPLEAYHHRVERSAQQHLAQRRLAAKRHNDGANLAYLDGHAGFRKGNQITIDLFREQKP